MPYFFPSTAHLKYLVNVAFHNLQFRTHRKRPINCKAVSAKYSTDLYGNKETSDPKKRGLIIDAHHFTRVSAS